MKKTFRRKVQRGMQLGRKLGFPTLNFHVGQCGEHLTRGVYTRRVFISKKPYLGILYFGPRLRHPSDVLEIHIPRFSRNLYGKWVSFRVGKRLRGPKTFQTLDALKEQIRRDIDNLKEVD
ncbi:MAG: riboflavin kinase [Candidatus Peregrinibacteria bacterium]